MTRSRLLEKIWTLIKICGFEKVHRRISPVLSLSRTTGREIAWYLRATTTVHPTSILKNSARPPTKEWMRFGDFLLLILREPRSRANHGHDLFRNMPTNRKPSLYLIQA